MKKLMILSMAFCLSTMKFFSLRLDRFAKFQHTSSVKLSLEFVFPISAWQSVRLCSICRSKRVLNCSLSELCLWISWPCAWLPSRQTTGFQVLSWLINDDDRQDDTPSPSEWSARLRHAMRSVRWWRHRNRSLKEPLLGHGLLSELDRSLCDEIVVGLKTCGERLVSRPHLHGEIFRPTSENCLC